MLAYGFVDGFSTGGGPNEILGLVAGDEEAASFIVGGGGDTVGGSSFLIREEMSKPRNGFCSLVAAVREKTAECSGGGGGDARGGDVCRPVMWKGGLILWRPYSRKKKKQKVN